jgi:hypothetical protein
MTARLAACLLALTSIAAAISTAGCSQEAEKKVAMRKACLAEIGRGYQGFYQANGQSPNGIEELASYITEHAKPDDEVASESATRLREGDIVMFWNVVLNGAGDENEKYVLGFEAAVPRAGGYLVTGGGSVVLVSPKSFGEYQQFPVKQE